MACYYEHTEGANAYNAEAETERILVGSLELLAADIHDDSFNMVQESSGPLSRCSSNSSFSAQRQPPTTTVHRDYTFDKYEGELRNQPKEVFVSSLVRFTKADEEELLKARSDLYACCMEAREDCPVGSLVKRLRPRLPTSDSLAVKLARDCHALYQYMCGATAAELGDVIPKSNRRPAAADGIKHSSQSISQQVDQGDELRALSAQVVALRIDLRERKDVQQLAATNQVPRS